MIADLDTQDEIHMFSACIQVHKQPFERQHAKA